jgi:hypothetical protein
MVDLSIVFPSKIVIFHRFPIKNGGSFHRFLYVLPGRVSTLPGFNLFAP